jgi:hypothetical protein
MRLCVLKPMWCISAYSASIFRITHAPRLLFYLLNSSSIIFRKGKKHPEKYSAGKKLILALGIDIANRQAKNHLRKTGKVEHDALASRSGKK